MYSLDSFTPPQEGLDELRDYVFLSVSAMPARIQIVIPDEWLVLFEQLIELHAKLGLVTTKSEIGREIIGMGMDAYRARINAMVAAVPKRPPVVLGPGGLVGVEQARAQAHAQAQAQAQAERAARAILARDHRPKPRLKRKTKAT